MLCINSIALGIRITCSYGTVEIREASNGCVAVKPRIRVADYFLDLIEAKTVYTVLFHEKFQFCFSAKPEKYDTV